MNRLKVGMRLALMPYSGGTTKDGPGGATNSVIPALPPSKRRFHMITPRATDSPRGAA